VTKLGAFITNKEQATSTYEPAEAKKDEYLPADENFKVAPLSSSDTPPIEESFL
jgi:hypothetical protein